jgi:putative oxidoreductase
MDLALFAVHVIVGLLLVGHGLQKLMGAFGGHGLRGTAHMMDSLGLRPPRVHAIAAGCAETTGGTLLALGLLTPIGAAFIIAVMLTAALTAHAGKGLWVTEGGFELPLTNAAIAFALAGAGPGEWSLDYALGLDMTGAGWALGALAVGVLGGLTAVLAGRIQTEREARAALDARARGRRARPGTPLAGH